MDVKRVILQSEKTFKIIEFSPTFEDFSSFQFFYDHKSLSIDKLIQVKWKNDFSAFICLYAHNYVEVFKVSKSQVTGENNAELVQRAFC